MSTNEDKQWDEDKFEMFVSLITEDGPIAKSIACKSLIYHPSGDSRVLPYLENAMEDKRICVVSKPITYSEVRFHASRALSAERRKQGIQESFILHQTFLPLSVDSAMDILLPNNDLIPQEIGLKGTVAMLMFLRTNGFFELKDYVFGES